MKTGIELIAEERQRQIEVERWNPEHDDEHLDNDLANAAACYAIPADMRDKRTHTGFTILHFLWPWNEKWWKPSSDNRLKELVKAGALIAAEIDRLHRKEAK